MLDGLQGSPVKAPEFQAYLKRQLLFEHQRRRLQRSKQGWMCTAIVALFLVGFTITRPDIILRLHGRVFPHGTPIAQSMSMPLERATMQQDEGDFDDYLVRSVAASMESDRNLAKQFVGSRSDDEILIPEEAFVISRFPLSGGRSMEIYTALDTDRQRQQPQLMYASTGGVW
jgi:hypothetical protein